jgi:hypothetical protein
MNGQSGKLILHASRNSLSMEPGLFPSYESPPAAAWDAEDEPMFERDDLQFITLAGHFKQNSALQRTLQEQENDLLIHEYF